MQAFLGAFGEQVAEPGSSTRAFLGCSDFTTEDADPSSPIGAIVVLSEVRGEVSPLPWTET